MVKKKQADSAQVVFGIHAVTAILERGPERVQILQCASQRKNQRIERVKTLAKQNGVVTTQTDNEELGRLAQGGRHQGVVALVHPQQALDENALDRLLAEDRPDLLLLFLDNVQDPHNLGACLRTADGAGVDAVICPRQKSASLTPAVRKIASGAAEFVPFIQVANLARALERVKQAGVWVYGAAGEADVELYDLEIGPRVALVLGNEGSGLRRLSAERCDQLFRLPMLGSVSSLNVSVAAGVCLYELVRQRQNLGVHE